MEVIVAKTAGFCFGVERAVNKVYEQIEKTSQPIYTYGPIIHNEEVVKDLEAKGVKLIADRKELEALTEGEGVIIIRSHGVSREVYEIAEKRTDDRRRHLPLRKKDSPPCGAGMPPEIRW